jgi:GAF domain-containing protein
LAVHHKQLQAWAEHCPENFENRAALVGAEIARLESRELDAERLYEQAIRSARTNGFIHNEALAYETAARFYAARGLEDFAELYLLRARDGYRRWGADGKVRQLEARYPQLAIAKPRGTAEEAIDQQLDVAAVVKASQALSSEMLLPRLIERLMTIAPQNAGADRGVLILPHESDYRIEAEARTDGERIVLHYGASIGQSVPESIIRYVMRTQESVILDDATKQNLFSEDPYFGLRQQRSILCLPLTRQGALGRLLYLENTLASHVFTPGRARLLELLAAQAAISLENTRLYGDLRKERRRSDALSIPTLSGYAYSISTVALSRPTTRFSTSWDMATTTSYRADCSGPP